MEKFYTYKYSLLLLILLLIVSSCGLENDQGIGDDNIRDVMDENIVDVTGKVIIADDSSELAEYYSYITSCAEDDFYIHTLVYAEDFRFEEGLVVPLGPINQVQWVTFEPLASGTFKAYSSNASSLGDELEKHVIIEIVQEFKEQPGNSGTALPYLSGSFYENPTYNSTAISNATSTFQAVRLVDCRFDDLEPSILTLPNGEMTEWAQGRSQFIIDTDTLQFSSVMQICNAAESLGFPLEGFIHIGHGVTNYNVGGSALAIAGEYLVYFNIEETPMSKDDVEAVLLEVNEDLILNFNSEYIQSNGMAIVLSVQLAEDDRMIASFTASDENAADFNLISATINTRIEPCN